MRLPIYCPRCEVKLLHKWEQPPRSFKLVGPWEEGYQVHTTTCQECGDKVYASVAASNVNRFDTWTGSRIDLIAPTDFITSRIYSNMQWLSPTIFWHWHPLQSSVEFRDRVLTAAIAKMIELKGNGPFIHVVFDKASAAIMERKFPVRRYCDVWLMKPPVTADAVGPFPSLSAELRMAHTVGYRNPKAFYHFWPSISFPFVDYIPVAEPQEIFDLWGMYARQNLKLQVKEADVKSN